MVWRWSENGTIGWSFLFKFNKLRPKCPKSKNRPVTERGRGLFFLIDITFVFVSKQKCGCPFWPLRQLWTGRDTEKPVTSLIIEIGVATVYGSGSLIYRRAACGSDARPSWMAMVGQKNQGRKPGSLAYVRRLLSRFISYEIMRKD